MIKQIINKIKEAAISVLPIYLLILIINFTPLVTYAKSDYFVTPSVLQINVTEPSMSSAFPAKD